MRSVFYTLLCNAVILVDFQADGRLTLANDRVKRAAEQDFRTCELTPSSPVAESESRVERTFSTTFSGTKDTESRNSWVRLGRVDTKSERLGTHYLEANTELRHWAFSRKESTVVPFEERERMKGEHTPKKDSTRHHQVLEEEDKFESSFLSLDRCCFLALLRVDTRLVAVFLECSGIVFGRICFPGRKGKLFQSNCLTT